MSLVAATCAAIRRNLINFPARTATRPSRLAAKQPSRSKCRKISGDSAQVQRVRQFTVDATPVTGSVLACSRLITRPAARAISH
jgi:hypothetical protein